MRSLIDVQNKADGLMYSASKTLEEFSEDVDASDKEAVAAQIEKTRDLMSGEDPAALEKAIEELSRLSYGLTEKLYAALGGVESDDIGGESSED
jgi:molecular chaperone DnaK